MHSKIFNLKSSDTRELGLNTNGKYLNYISDPYTSVSNLQRVLSDHGAFIDVSASTSFLTNYPKNNIIDSYSLTKEARANIITKTADADFDFGYKFSGITLNISSINFSTYSSILLMINKINTSYINSLKSSSIKYYINFRHTTVSANSKILEITLSTNSTNIIVMDINRNTLYSTDYYENSVDSGIILIDETLLYNIFGTENINNTTYKVDIYTQQRSSFAGMQSFSVSNIFVGNSINFFAEEGVKFQDKNLNKYFTNDRTGKVFTQINSSIKSLELKFSNLTTTELLSDVKEFIFLNKDAPFIVLPYNNFNNNYTYNADSQKWQRLNYLMGGLYYIENYFELENPVFDVYDYSLKLKEYK